MEGLSGDIWQGYYQKQTFFGYRLHLLISLSGLILDFELTLANCQDPEIGFELLSEHTDLEVLRGKAYISAAKAMELCKKRIVLRTMPCSDQKQQFRGLIGTCTIPSTS